MIKTSIDSNVRYDSLDKLLYHLPKVVIVNKFNEEAALQFARDIAAAQNTRQPVIPVIIDSYGGEAYSLMAMIDAIKSVNETPVATIVRGKAMSCGAILFTFGTEGYRFMGPSATLMIHDVASTAKGKVEEIKADAKETDRLNDLVYEMMAKNCGHPDPRYFWKIVHDKGRSDWFMDAREARQHNIANHIRVPSMNLSVKYDLQFC